MHSLQVWLPELFSWGCFTLFASKTGIFWLNNHPDWHHLQGCMKFATQISPLLNFKFKICSTINFQATTLTLNDSSRHCRFCQIIHHVRFHERSAHPQSGQLHKVERWGWRHKRTTQSLWPFSHITTSACCLRSHKRLPIWTGTVSVLTHAIGSAFALI